MQGHRNGPWAIMRQRLVTTIGGWRSRRKGSSLVNCSPLTSSSTFQITACHCCNLTLERSIPRKVYKVVGTRIPDRMKAPLKIIMIARKDSASSIGRRASFEMWWVQNLFCSFAARNGCPTQRQPGFHRFRGSLTAKGLTLVSKQSHTHLLKYSLYISRNAHSNPAEDSLLCTRRLTWPAAMQLNSEMSERRSELRRVPAQQRKCNRKLLTKQAGLEGLTQRHARLTGLTQLR